MSKSEPRELLQELTRLETLRDPGNTQSKRKFERYVVRSEAELLHMDRSSMQQSPISIMLRDVGRGGIGFVSNTLLEMNSTWHVTFIHDGYIVGTQGMIVCHCRHVRENAYLVGGQFCADSGLLTLLGVRPFSLRDSAEAASSESGDEGTNFFAPGDISQE